RRGLTAKAGRADMLVVGKKNFNSPALAAAMHVWAWEEAEAERVALVRRCSSMGLTLVNASLLLFSRHRVNSHANEGAVALVRLEQGGYEDALKVAQIDLGSNPRSVDSYLVMLELALEGGNQAVAESALQRLRELAPHHPRLRELASLPGGSVRGRRAGRMARTARALLDQQRLAEAGKAAQQALGIDPQSAEASFVLGAVAARGPNPESALGQLHRATQLAPEQVEYWREIAAVLRRLDRTPDALAAGLRVAELEPHQLEHQLALADAALAAGHAAIAQEALDAAAELRPGHPLLARWRLRVEEVRAHCRYDEPRDLLLAHVEVNRLQGTGVLLERFFPDARPFVTVRSRTLYQGVVHFGGVHFSIDLPGLTECARARILRRLLAPFQIRRILCVPFFASDFMHALAARDATGAPLCTYVMDDQVLHARDVASELAARVFAASAVRLAISPEMIAEYTTWFGCSFGLLPPIVTTRDHEVPNDWSPARGQPQHAVMVGNIWSARQFDQIRAFARAAGLRIDWFGNHKVAWLPQDRAALEADGIFCQGFLPEDQLAQRLANYPFVVLPSGALDGTEDNEWLTRLSLPSRMVFIVTKTFTPMLVLGSEQTAAARFVRQFGLGLTSNYDASEAAGRIAAITAPESRAGFVAQARQVAPAFLFPGCGEWIWRSLAAGAPLPTPFDGLYRNDGDIVPVETDAGSVDGPAFDRMLPDLLAKLSDHALHDSYLPPDEPRQRLDIR
ncbi:MAG: tetratricopeptide repeat protein, partial [Opitutaceae bacterium]|nr:tetratricopeptide repeat protein [Opitutaceae bacterium]